VAEAGAAAWNGGGSFSIQFAFEIRPLRKHRNIAKVRVKSIVPKPQGWPVCTPYFRIGDIVAEIFKEERQVTRSGYRAMGCLTQGSRPVFPRDTITVYITASAISFEQSIGHGFETYLRCYLVQAVAPHLDDVLALLLFDLRAVCVFGEETETGCIFMTEAGLDAYWKGG